MELVVYLGIWAASVVCGVVGVGWLRGEALRRHWLDRPNERSFHENPVPRIGGLGVLLPVVVALLAAVILGGSEYGLVWATVLGLVMGLFSLGDDFGDFPRWLRFSVHLLLGGVMIWWARESWSGAAFPLLGVELPALLTVVLLLVWVAGLTNAYNFMDGIDGIGAMQGLVAVAGWLSVWWVFGGAGGEGSIWILLAVGGGLVGFLFFNWSPASLFMGDSGSTFLGMWLALVPLAAVVELEMSFARAFEGGFLFVWPFVADAATTMVRRAIRRENIFEAHRTHVYQLLAGSFGSREEGHRMTTLLFGGLAAVGVLLFWKEGALWAKLAICGWLWLAVATWCYGIRARSNSGSTGANSENQSRVNNPMQPSLSQKFDIFLSPPTITEAEQRRLGEAVASGFIAPVGPQLDEFERGLGRYLGVEPVLALSSGTAANHLGLRALGVGEGDCVLCPDLTFIATVNPVRYLGAEPVLVDVEPGSWAMDPVRAREALEALLSEGKRVKALMVVHAFGIPAPMEALQAVAAEFGVPILEDCAGAFGTLVGDRYAGTLGEAGAYSFNGNKVLTTSGGGALVLRDGERLLEARTWANQGKETGKVGYVHETLGYNYKLSNLSAAVGLGQLETLADRLEQKERVFRQYADLLGGEPNLLLMPEPTYGKNNYWLTCVGFTGNGKAWELVQELRAEGIEASPMWRPMHQQKINEDLRCFGGEISEDIAERFLCLPSGTTLTEEQLNRIARRVKEA